MSDELKHEFDKSFGFAQMVTLTNEALIAVVLQKPGWQMVRWESASVRSRFHDQVQPVQVASDTKPTSSSVVCAGKSTYPLSYRQVAEMVNERGMEVNHTSTKCSFNGKPFGEVEDLFGLAK